MAEMPKVYEPFFNNLRDDPRQLARALGAVVCTEDRGVEGFPYAIQVAGGAHGLATDIHTAGMIESGKLVELWPGSIATDARTIALHTGATSHEKCAADNQASDFDTYVANPDNRLSLWESANRLLPGAVELADVEHAQVAAEYRLSVKGLYLPESERLEVLTAEDGPGESVSHLQLYHKGGHAAKVMVGNGVPDTFPDTVRAYKEDLGMYGFTVHSIGRIAHALAAVFPYDKADSLVKATAIRQAAIAANLPNPAVDGGRGVATVYRGQSLALVA